MARDPTGITAGLPDRVLGAGSQATLPATPTMEQFAAMCAPAILRDLPELEATEALARAVAAHARAGDVVLLEGPLGAGKTTFARAFLRAASADPTLEVPSPTFTLVQSYETRLGPVHHFDLWRIENSGALGELGWDEALEDIVLVEWPDRLGPLRPRNALTLALQPGEGETRIVRLSGWPDRLGALA